ncbi:SDR family NAD(P)-dependent oxidoreductase [Halomonas sp. E14]|uniref:SDR family NAD(P)-dependent oxidoreductase n=1 Tax=Halomonas sp. E14 TaxID=3397245 RepID=UPI00403E58F0
MSRRVAFITGASRGIGRATALAFARAGFDLVITGRTQVEGQLHEHALSRADGTPLPGSLAETAQALKECGAEVLALPMDLLDSASVEASAQQALAHFGRVDVLINNAIYQGRDLNAPFMALTAETLTRVAQGYLIAPVLLTQALLPAMLSRSGGVVINITSGAGEKDPPLPADKGGWGYAYGAGKAAVSRLSGVLAREFGDQGIRAYTVNPGVVATEALQATLGEDGELARRYGAVSPALPAAVLLWLATAPEAESLQYRTLDAQPLARERGLFAEREAG